MLFLSLRLSFMAFARELPNRGKQRAAGPNWRRRRQRRAARARRRRRRGTPGRRRGCSGLGKRGRGQRRSEDALGEADEDLRLLLTLLAAAMASGLESLGGLILEIIMLKAGARGAAALACASTRLRAVASDDAVWRCFCADDFLLDDAVRPDGLPCASFKEAYKTWINSFSMYPLALVRRVKQLWISMKTWLAENFPEALDSLQPGLSETHIKLAEEALGFNLPMPTRLLYRFCDGQLPFPNERSAITLNAPFGIIGGYEFYEHAVNVHLSPLSEIVNHTKAFAKEYVPKGAKLILVAFSWYAPKFFFLDCIGGQLLVATRNFEQNAEMIPCVPKTLLDVTGNEETSQDGLLLWLEEHLRRLQSGVIKTRGTGESKYICLYPEDPPFCTSAITSGVKVRSSAVFVPEYSDCEVPEYYYSYSIRMSLLPEGCLVNGVRFSSCQLRSRHWLIRSRDRIVAKVNAEAVIGKYPLLLPGREEFVYESCTPIPEFSGSVEGSFTFVPGSLGRPEGGEFDVMVAHFPLEKPQYIF